MPSWIFSNHYSSVQCHMILQKSVEYADLLLMKHFLFSQMKKFVLLHILWNPWFIFYIYIYCIYFFSFKLLLNCLFISFNSCIFWLLSQRVWSSVQVLLRGNRVGSQIPSFTVVHLSKALCLKLLLKECLCNWLTVSSDKTARKMTNLI